MRADAISALVLSPCCLRGALGAKIGKWAKAQRQDPYRLLVAVLAALARDSPFAALSAAPAAELASQLRQAGSGDEAEAAPAAIAADVVYDEAVLSPKNAFVVVVKQPSAALDASGVTSTQLSSQDEDRVGTMVGSPALTCQPCSA